MSLEYHKKVQEELEKHKDFDEFIEILRRRDQGSSTVMFQFMCEYGYMMDLEAEYIADAIIRAARAADRELKRSEH